MLQIRVLSLKLRNSVVGTCKIGDTANFFLQGTQTKTKIDLGSINLDNISKIKVIVSPRLKVMDMATALTG